MKKLLLPFLLLLSINIFGQEFNKIQIAATFSPDYDYRTLKSTGKQDETGHTSNEMVDFLNDKDIGKFGFTTGVSAIYNFSKLFGIEIGVQYSDKGYQAKWREIELMEPNLVLYKYKNISKYEYIDVPLKTNFTFGKNKLRYIATVGIAANFLIEAKAISDNETKKHTQITTSHYNKFNISPIIGAGIEYRISNKISLKAIPNFKYGLIKMYDTPYQSERLWNAGIDIGIYYGIK